MRKLFAPFFGSFLIDHTGVQVGVNGHLFAWHGVQGEAGVDLRDPSGTLGHHNEVDDHQDGKNDEAHHVVAANDDVPERCNHFAGSFLAFVAIDQDDPGRGDVQRQPQHRGKQQYRRKGRELQWLTGANGDHDDQQTGGDIEGEQDVQQPRREWQHQHGRDQQDKRRNAQPFEAEARQHLSNT